MAWLGYSAAATCLVALALLLSGTQSSSLQYPAAVSRTATPCVQPVDARMYKNCTVSRSERPFPREQLTCRCAQCDLRVEFRCQGGQWVPPPGPNLCDATSAAHGCGRCMATSVLHDVTCGRAVHAGYLGEVRSCTCLRSCLLVSLQCHKDGLWHYDCRVPPLQSIPGSNLSLRFDEATSAYTFSCSPGLQLRGAAKLACVDGALPGHLPQCAPKTGEVTPESSLPQSMHHYLVTTPPRVSSLPPTTPNSPAPPIPTSATNPSTLLSTTTETTAETENAISLPSIDEIEEQSEEQEYEEDPMDSKTKDKKIGLSIIDYILIAVISVILIVILIVCIFIRHKYFREPKVELRNKNIPPVVICED